MLKIAVMVSGGGTNLQAIIDAIANGTITDTQIVAVISNNADAYALERARNAGIKPVCVSRKEIPDRAAYDDALLAAVEASGADLIVLAGFLVVIPT
ncbi:MAG: phosphoribosylglycinamide formyltransferase, partial [Lachnospiraceae bacterium]|nr:phosphoribosylglycinamide formyltransferase [Lachnospiraceae bacterium]